MKAVAVFPDQKKIDLIDQPEPEIKTPTGVKVQVLEVGICGTDREIAAFEYGTPPSGRDHLVIGHESLSRVIQVGPDVSTLKKGDLVVLIVRRPCSHPECIACRSGRPDFCYTGDYQERGIKGLSGYMTEFVVDEETFIVPVPSDLRDVGVLTEPLTIAEKAIEQVRQVQQRLPWGWPDKTETGQPGQYRHQAVVLGVGPVGLLGAMALAANGFQIHAYSRESRDDPKAQIVTSIGGTYTNSQEVSLKEFAGKIGNIDLVYEATGAAQVSFDMLQYLGINAVFIFTGVPGRKGTFQFDGNAIMRDMVLKNQILFGTVNAPRKAFEDAVKDLAVFQKRWPGALRSIITGKYPMGRYQDLLSGKVPGIKNVVTIA